jgi:hypothetical protein
MIRASRDEAERQTSGRRQKGWLCGIGANQIVRELAKDAIRMVFEIGVVMKCERENSANKEHNEEKGEILLRCFGVSQFFTHEVH